MLVKDFVKEYCEKDDRAASSFLKNHIVADAYVPYEVKIKVCTEIAKNTLFDLDGEYFVDTPLRYSMFVLMIVDLYTDLDVDFENSMNDFNLLDKYNLIDAIIDQISNSEYKKFQVVMDMVKEDIYENHRSVSRYAKDFFELINDLKSSFVDTMDSNVMEMVNENGLG